jgi:DNA polymerase III gamma/tau subunit
MPQLFEQYRPKTWDEVVGQNKAIRQIRNLAKRGLGGRAFWISGKTGTGKTTIARLLADEIAEEWTTVEIDSAEFTPKAIVDAERRMRCYGMGEKNGHALIVNEAHGLRKDAIKQLLVTLERPEHPIPEHVVWIFTTTLEGQQSLFDEQIDAHPLLSRCQEVKLTKNGLKKAFARRCREIAIAEDLCDRHEDDAADLLRYEMLAEECKCNMRQMLQKIEGGEMMTDDPSFEEMFT